MTIEKAREILNAFAIKHKVIFEEEGECGFGRECVGINGGNGNWIDFNPWTFGFGNPIEELYMPNFPSSENAYHKHNCLVILGRGKKAVMELAEWIWEINKCGTVEVHSYETGATGFQAVLSGVVGRAVFVPELHGPVPQWARGES